MSSEVPKPSILLNGLISVSAVCAIQWGMKRNLETQSSILQVVPPDEPIPTAISPSLVAVPPPRTWIARIKPNQTQCWLLVQYAGITFCAIVLPKYGSRFLLDVAWGGFEVVLLTFVYQRSFDVVLPRPEVLRYRHPKNPRMKTFVLEISQVDPLSFLQKDWTRVGLGVIAAFLTLFALATGHRNVLAIATTAWTLSATSVFVGPMMSVRGFTLLILGFHVVAIAATVIGVAATAWFHPTNPTFPKKAGNFAQPSSWLGELMMICTWLLITAMPAGIIDLTNRFEHLSHVILIETSSGPGEPTPIKRGKPFFGTRTLTNIGMISFAFSLTLLVVLTEVYSENKKVLDWLSAGSALSVSFTVLGIVLGAWSQGRLRDWWGYHEQWASCEVGLDSDAAGTVNPAVGEKSQLDIGV